MMDAESAMEPMVRVAEQLAHGLARRWSGFVALPQDMSAFQASVGATGWSVTSVLSATVIVAATAMLVRVIARRTLLLHRPAPGQPGIGSELMISLVAMVCAAFIAMLLADAGPVRRSLVGFAVLIPAAIFLSAMIHRIVLSGGEVRDSASLTIFSRDIGRALLWAFAGAAVLATLRQLGAPPGLRDIAGTLGIAIPLAGLLVFAYWRSRRVLAFALAGEPGRLRWRRRLAARWPGVAISLAIMAFLATQLVATLGQFVPTVAAASTLLLLLLWPHIDDVLRRWAMSGLETASLPIGMVAIRQTLRIAAITAIIVALLTVWSEPVAAITGMALGDILRPLSTAGAVIMTSAFLWNLTGAATERTLRVEQPISDGDDHDGGTVPRSRLGTLLPLLAGTAKIAIMAMTLLTVLLALGINVWPLVTGLSVFGLAIGFGSQTLVKDIVSGLFFLFDDAFRLGEYIETSGAKGAVEKISIRSLSLRHPRGAVATVPYGQIGKITNYSRDWVIEKLVFRVAFDTDVEKVRKLFKEIGLSLMENPEIRKDLIETFKSQGIAEVEDGTLLIRGKFKARAGQQFNARKAVLAAVHKGFRERGIEAVPKPLLREAA